MKKQVLAVMSAVDLPKDSPIYADILNVVSAHHDMIFERNGKHLQANHVRKCLKNRGWFEGICYIVTKGDEDGFNELAASARVNDTFEALVVKYKNVFPPRVVQIADKRLQEERLAVAELI